MSWRVLMTLAAAVLGTACCPPCATRAAAPPHAFASALTVEPEPVPPECQPVFPRDCNFARPINGTNYCCGHDVTVR